MSGYGEPSAKFAINVGPQDVGLYTDVEPRIPSSHTAIDDYQKDLQDVMSNNISTTRWQFKTEKNCDHWERMWLTFQVNALTGTSATYNRLVDGFGLHLFERIELRCGTLLVQTIYPSEDTYLRWMKETKFEKTFDLYPTVGLGLTKAERNTRATGIQEFHVPLDFWWRDDIRKDPIVPGIALGLIVDCYLRTASEVIESDAADAAFTLTGPPVLRQELVFTAESTRYMKVQMVTGGNQVTYFYDEQVSVPHIDVPSGTTETQDIRIEGLNGPMKHLYVLVTPKASRTTAYAHDYGDFSWNYNPYTLRIRANQNDLCRAIPLRDFLQPMTNSRYYTGLPFPGILLNFSENPESVNMASGVLNLAYASVPTIKFTWKTATTQDLQIRLRGYAYNWIQHSGGQFRRIFIP